MHAVIHTGMHTGMRTKAPHLHGGNIPACAADNYDAAQPQGRKQPPAFVQFPVSSVACRVSVYLSVHLLNSLLSLLC